MSRIVVILVGFDGRQEVVFTAASGKLAVFCVFVCVLFWVCACNFALRYDISSFFELMT